VVGELLAGFALGAHRGRNTAELDALLDTPVVHEIAADHAVAEIYADLLLSLRAAGTPIPTNDIWIGACAVRAGATVVTYDAHFESMRRVGVVLLDARATL
jgi:tRNA(fMet)-specific endonuclease VapC